ncbi:aminodeoxychorismate synthase, glutamine amidotransferase subunit [Dethiosulfatibacter aminovorans DSM 17477]|uniref:Aminodeoxychorismate synthase, glutamine amidotransferase subunit n=1 Tax=Dethiosulfatibacter aminovorans DSM 17477 TaxID=1121476 RepID=A0A1M6GQ83_9FIRM|nr:aminodeoxychorismate/anthranilate synthase component II [Dethiosulfatibacter aminovorans]SHJ12040.1 aminodeoxychorismate synthase, glutamine amidotransferase subunit [Dethiosulfatibacter aminovorans DSM 17477]
MFLMIDNYDSFVYNLVHYFEELGEEIEIRRNDCIDMDTVENMNPEGIIISPGPKDPTETGVCEEIIRRFAGRIPILGVCLGHQTIGHVFGARIVKGERPMHGKISPVSHKGKGVFKNIVSPFTVTRYHSLVIDEDTLPIELEVTAVSDDGAIMGIRHREYLLEGVQFHPEAVLTQHGHDILGNFVDMCRKEEFINAV